MELSPYVEALRREFSSLTSFVPDDVARVAERLADALDSAVRLTLLDVLAAAAAELTAQLDDTVVDVRLGAGQAEFVVTPVPPRPVDAPANTPETAAAAGAPGAPGEEAGMARITLRLSEALKAQVDAAAAAEGLSVNSWLAHAAARALAGQNDPPRGRARPGIGQRITGYARG
jgi:hypothetical protein